MFFIMKRDNTALDINKPDADRSLTVEGSDWLWAATAVFGVTFLSWLAYYEPDLVLLPTMLAIIAINRAIIPIITMLL